MWVRYQRKSWVSLCFPIRRNTYVGCIKYTRVLTIQIILKIFVLLHPIEGTVRANYRYPVFKYVTINVKYMTSIPAFLYQGATNLQQFDFDCRLLSC